MNISDKLPSYFILMFVFILQAFKSDNHMLSIRMESKRLYKGKVVVVRADLFFRYSEGNLLIHYYYPANYIFITNNEGEAKMYFPDKNEVITQQNQLYASDNDTFYFYRNNQVNDPGLKLMGYSVISTHFEDGITITDWLPPGWQTGIISMVELAHDSFLPIYTAYYNTKNKAIRKVYFSNYYMSSFAALPQRITEIEYLPDGDSIITRKIYSDINFDINKTNEYFDFKIPVDAKSLSLQKK